jgi:hypothetical protein
MLDGPGKCLAQLSDVAESLTLKADPVVSDVRSGT